MAGFPFLTSQFRNVVLLPRLCMPSNIPVYYQQTVVRALLIGTSRQSQAYYSMKRALNGENLSHKMFKRGLSFGTLLLTGFGIGVAWSQSSHKELEIKDTKINLGIPSVQAALPTEPPDDINKKNSRRKMFNFISDVVQTCGPSVVYIEIIDTRYNRSVYYIYS